MVAKNDLLTAASKIEEALWGFVAESPAAKVHVFESDWGHLRALVGSDGFKDASIGRRQEMVWKYLREHVSPEHLVHLYGVHPMDLEEYDVYARQEK